MGEGVSPLYMCMCTLTLNQTVITCRVCILLIIVTILVVEEIKNEEKKDIYLLNFQVPNLLPTVSSAIGGFTPQRYVWRICICMQTGLRFLLAFCYYHWHQRVNVGLHQNKYNTLVGITVMCHVVENLALVTLTAVSSTDNGSESSIVFY